MECNVTPLTFTSQRHRICTCWVGQRSKAGYILTSSKCWHCSLPLSQTFSIQTPLSLVSSLSSCLSLHITKHTLSLYCTPSLSLSACCCSLTTHSPRSQKSFRATLESPPSFSTSPHSLPWVLPSFPRGQQHIQTCLWCYLLKRPVCFTFRPLIKKKTHKKNPTSVFFQLT